MNWSEVTYALRSLRKQPLVSALAVLSIALGIAVNSSFFGLVDVLILRSVDVPHPEQLVRVSTVSPTGRPGDDRLLLSMFKEIQERSNVFAGVFAWDDDALRNMQAEGVRFLGSVNEVSGEFFRTLEEQPLLGRGIEDRDVNIGSGQSAAVAVLSDRCWREHYHADPRVVGKTITVDDVRLTIIGVTKPDFSEIDMEATSDAIVPIGFAPSEGKRRWFNVTARRKPGVSLAEAQAQLATLWPSVLESAASPTMKPDARARFFTRRLVLTSAATGDSFLREEYARPLIMLTSLSGMIFLVTCVNLASIMLARAVSRRSEFQVRLALGATRWKISRLVLIEAVFISLAGSVIGTAAAFWSTRLLIGLFWMGIVSPGLHMTVDLRLLMFMVGAAFLTAILFGLAPAIQATRINPSPASQYNKGATGRFRIGKGLIVTQVAVAFVLVTAAVILATSLHNLRSVHLGYDRNDVLVMTLFSQSARARIPNTAGYYRQLASELQSIPGTQGATYSQSTPAFGFESALSVGTPEATVPALYDSVGPRFFELMGIPVLSGREFGWQDDETAPHVAILSENLASQLFPHENPIGRKVDFGTDLAGKGLTVVGVVGNAALWRPQTPNPRAIYLPLMQRCSPCDPLALVRSNIDPLAIARLSERTVQSMGYQYSVRTQSLEEKFNKMLVVERLSSGFSAAFGCAALVLASLGLYGLISYIVHMRHLEIGIRIALGATRAGVLSHILSEALAVVTSGVLIGAPLAWLASRALANKYVNLRQGILIGMGCASFILLATALVAAFVPARRASHVEPGTALRSE